MAPCESNGFSSDDSGARCIRSNCRKNKLALREVETPSCGCFRITYSDGTEFIIDRDGFSVLATWRAPLTLEDTATYLLGPIFGFLLRLRGVTCLHACAVAVDGKAVVLTGPSGVGKSTTAAAFARSGFPVLSEDVVALCDHGGDFLAQPGYQMIRLWPDSVQALYDAADALPLLTPNWDKRYLPLTGNGCRFQPDPLPLAAIYLLVERSNDVRAPFVESIPSQTGLITLIANTYANQLLNQEMRGQEFETLGRLVDSVPLRQITPHTDPARLPELCQTIVDDFRSLTVK